MAERPWKSDEDPNASAYFDYEAWERWMRERKVTPYMGGSEVLEALESFERIVLYSIMCNLVSDQSDEPVIVDKGEHHEQPARQSDVGRADD